MKQRFKPYFYNIILIWLIFAIYKYLPYYKTFLSYKAHTAIMLLAITYTILAFFYYLAIPPKTKSKGQILFQVIINNLKKASNFKRPSLNKEEKTQILFLLVKVFFLPIMIQFSINNFFFLKSNLPNLSLTSLTLQGFNLVIFPILIGLIFFIDTLYFTFGYSTESKYLKNKIHSVEPTLFGWLIALACYPPFNGFVTKYVNWFANDYAFFYTDAITFLFRIAIIILLGIYVSASISLGTKCSNLTNRGIVTRGTYSIVRHPAYISKNLAWWLTVIPVMSIPAFISMGTWSLIYHFRALTEEKHLSQDLEYQAYMKKVKHRYIPWVY